MSEYFVNQLTLNFLISKTQLNRLNKRMKDSKEETDKLNDKHIYKERIKQLFNNLFNEEKPNDLLQDVETGFNFFVEKAVYYLKVHDKNLDLEKERQSNHSESESQSNENSISNSDSDAEDYYNDDKPDYFSEENSDVGNETEDEESNEIINNQFNLINSVKMETNTTNSNNSTSFTKIVNKKNTIISKGVENIDDLNYNWFEYAKRNVKKHNIIPRTKS